MTSEALWYLAGQEPAGISVATEDMVLGSDTCLSTIHRTQVSRGCWAPGGLRWVMTVVPVLFVSVCFSLLSLGR